MFAPIDIGLDLGTISLAIELEGSGCMNHAMLSAIAKAIKEAIILNKKLAIGTVIYWFLITILQWKGLFTLIGLGLLGYLIYKIYKYVRPIL